MATLFVRHKVKDFRAWKADYDEFQPTAREMGVTADGVYQADGDPNDVTVTHEFNTVDEAKALVASPRLKEAMEKAGVVGAPDIWITTRA